MAIATTATPKLPTPAPVPSTVPKVANRMVNGVPVTTPTDMVPPGTPYYTSSPLVNGGLNTPEGDVFNQFRGYVGPEGGTFGGYDTVDPATGSSPRQQFDAMDKAVAGIGPIDWTQVDRAALDQQRRVPTADDLNAQQGWRQTLAAGGTLDPTQLAILKTAADPLADPFRSTNDAIRLGISATGAPMDPAADYYDRGAQAGAWTPEQAAQLRTQFAEREAKAAQEQGLAPMPDALDADPFGRFDSAQSPTHGIIKPTADGGEAAALLRTSRMLTPTLPTPNDPFAAFQNPAQPLKNVLTAGAGTGAAPQPPAVSAGTDGAIPFTGEPVNLAAPGREPAPPTDLGGRPIATPGFDTGMPAPQGFAPPAGPIGAGGTFGGIGGGFGGIPRLPMGGRYVPTRGRKAERYRKMGGGDGGDGSAGSGAAY